nr:probable acyl-activating enzyme 1, peroxisomal [Tanacetum cinerariifolium]
MTSPNVLASHGTLFMVTGSLMSTSSNPKWFNPCRDFIFARVSGGSEFHSDRSKDIIISGGENISTIEVESVLFRHPAVLEAAVVGRPDDHWGETPCAFVKVKEGYKLSADELIAFCRKNLPRYMAPRTVVFEELPKTSTGKTQKFVLREKAKAMGSLSSKGKSKL